MPSKIIARILGFALSICLFVTSAGCGGGKTAEPVERKELDIAQIAKEEAVAGQFTLTADNSAKADEYLLGLSKVSFKEFEDYGDYVISRKIVEEPELINTDQYTDTIYPGAIIKGASLSSGNYALSTLSRTPITISGTFPTTDPDGLIAEVADPNIGTVRQAVNYLVSKNLENDTSAGISFTLNEIKSTADLSLNMGIHGGNQAVKGKLEVA